jgi:mannose-6-phosphate isomerase-like protein (cupin superfamily)
MKVFEIGRMAVIGLAALTAAGAAQAQGADKAPLAGPFHMTKERGPIRKVDLSPTKEAVSSEILAGPTAGLDSAWIVYTRIASRTQPKGLVSLPVDQTYLVLSGKLNVQLGTDRFVAEPETLVLVPAGVPHRVWNAGTEPVADFEVISPAPTRDLASMFKPAAAKKIDNAAQYVRVPPKLDKLAGGQGHESLNERVLADRSTGSDHVLERLNDVMPGGGRTDVHIHPFDQVYFIRKGTMKVLYGMSTFDAPANSLVVLPAGVVHNNSNDGASVQSSITLLLPEPQKGQPLGTGVTLQGRGNQAGRTQ